jgi:hypothetical protein
MGRALWILSLITMGCSGAGVHAARPVGTPSTTAATWSADRPVAVSAVPGSKKRGAGGPLFQVRLVQDGAAGRTVRSPGEAAIQ